MFSKNIKIYIIIFLALIISGIIFGFFWFQLNSEKQMKIEENEEKNLEENTKNGDFDPSKTPELGNNISWQEALLLLEQCQVKSITQTHDLSVYLDLADGRQLITKEPQIDEIFGVYEGIRKKCGEIPMATE